MSIEHDKNKKPIIAVGILIFNSKKKILLGERFSEFGKGTKALPGGKVEDETFIEASKREVFEETGLSDSEIIIGKIISVAYENIYGLDGLTVGFLAETENEPKEEICEEIGDWKWFDLDNLPEDIFPPSKRIIDNYKNNIVLSR